MSARGEGGGCCRIAHSLRKHGGRVGAGIGNARSLPARHRPLRAGSEAEILAAMRLILETEHWVIEGAAAVAVASYLKDAPRYQGKTVAIVLCGRNVSP